MSDVINIKKQDLFDKFSLDRITIGGYIPLSDELRNLFSDLIEEEDVETVSLQFEYWIDEETFHYNLEFEFDTINVNDRMESNYLNNIVKEFCLEGKSK